MNPAQPNDQSGPADGDLAAWLSRLVDGQLTAGELAQLEERLLKEPAALAEYCDFLDTEFMLAWELKCRGMADCRSIAPPLPPLARLRHFAAAWLLPLVLVGGGCLGLWMLGTGGNGSAGQPAAVLSRVDAAVWKSPSDIVAGRALPAGSLALVEGTAQLTFASGAVVAVQAPAEVEVLGHNRLLLRRGRVTPYVPVAAKGFTVVSPTGEVVDLGTEFSMSVGEGGKTDVFVINGEVDVGLGQLSPAEPVRLTQGFASTVNAGVAAPRVTQRPILIERFDTPTSLFRRVGPGNDDPMVVGGELRIPIEGRPDKPDPTVQVLIDRDLSALVGTRSTISYKISMPAGTGLATHRWAGLGIDSGAGPLPWAHRPGAVAGVLVSPKWQVGLYMDGTVTDRKPIWPRQTVFPRGSEAVGPYQIVITIDDTPAARGRLGGAAFGFMANGLEFVRDYPIQLGTQPRMAFQTFLPRGVYGVGYAVIDDFSISVEALPETEDS